MRRVRQLLHRLVRQAQDPVLGRLAGKLDSLLDASKYVGRAPEQTVGEFRRAVRRAAALVAPAVLADPVHIGRADPGFPDCCPAVRAIGLECPDLDFTGLDFLEVPGNDLALLPVRVAGLGFQAPAIAPECCQVRERETAPGDPVPAFDP